MCAFRTARSLDSSALVMMLGGRMAPRATQKRQMTPENARRDPKRSIPGHLGSGLLDRCCVGAVWDTATIL